MKNKIVSNILIILILIFTCSCNNQKTWELVDCTEKKINLTIPMSQEIINSTKNCNSNVTVNSIIENDYNWEDGKKVERINNFVYYNQNDEPWCDMMYGDDLFKDVGCGPTCMAMVISQLSDTIITPRDTCNYSISHNMYSPDNGTYGIFFVECAADYNLSVAKEIWNYEKVYSYLKNGKAVICCVGPGDFTNDSHFLILSDCTDDYYLTVIDSFSRENTTKKWAMGDIEAQLQYSTIWIYG